MSGAVEALRAGASVILPTDTVYGLCASLDGPEPAARLYALKGRDLAQPSALLAADVETLLTCLPELRGAAEAIVRALLPGAFTLVLPNPAERYRWIAGATPQAIGVRVAVVPPPCAEVLAAVGCVVATSANLAGGPEARRVADLPAELVESVGAVVDAGELPGTPSTVIDFTGDAPRVIREGAEPAAPALERAALALA